MKICAWSGFFRTAASPGRRALEELSGIDVEGHDFTVPCIMGEEDGTPLGEFIVRLDRCFSIGGPLLE